MDITEEQLRTMTPEQLAELQKRNCVFCQLGTGRVPAKKLYEDEELFAVLDINPAAQGHVLLLTREHYAVMPQVPDHIVERMFMVAKGLSQAALKGLPAKGTTLFIANGIVAGQKAPHVMLHVIPRKEDDGIGLDVPKGTLSDAAVSAARQRLQAALKAAGRAEGAEGKKLHQKEEQLQPQQKETAVAAGKKEKADAKETKQLRQPQQEETAVKEEKTAVERKSAATEKTKAAAAESTLEDLTDA